jgi:archaellum component FlaC
MKKLEAKTKKVDSETMAVGEIKRHMSDLSEEFQGRVKAIGEQFSGLNKRLDSHDEKFEKIDNQFKKIDGQFRVVHHTLGAMKEDLEVMKEDLAIIKSDVRKRVTYEEFESLSKRVILLEKKSHRAPLK